MDRINRSPVFMERPALTLVLSPQPDVLRDLINKPVFLGRGLLARFWYTLPRSPLGQRTGQAPAIPQSVANQYSAAINKMLKWSRNEKPIILHFSEEAHAEYEAYWLAVEKDMADGGRFESIRGWAGKLPGLAVRIAGLLHCAEHASGTPSSAPANDETMHLARAIGEVASEHALATFDLMGEDSALAAARKAWKWIERKQQRSFKFRNCWHALRSTYRRADDLNPAFDVLVERGFIVSLLPEEKVGRPSRPYLVNPSLTEGWS